MLTAFRRLSMVRLINEQYCTLHTIPFQLKQMVQGNTDGDITEKLTTQGIEAQIFQIFKNLSP